MSFASPIFLWFFLPCTLALTWLLPDRFRNAVVALTSLIFYAVGAGALVLLLLGSVAFNFAIGRLLGAALPGRARQAVLVAAVAVDVGVLALWKYADFATRQIDHLSRALGLGHSGVLHLVLPIGISFYVFHQVSYVVDVYRRVRPPQRDPLAFLTYVSMFPQLIAGPIVRYHEIADQLGARTSGRWDDLADGFPRFCLGLAKKVVIADSIAPLAQAVFDVPVTQVHSSGAWIGVLAYTLQIYFDFSGYSDMAIGLGRMIGFQLPENFDRPYSSQSITEFWRRWHMSLSRWFRDYLYIPLGGNRSGAARTYRNLVIVFLLVGLWHGANWTFLVWGAYHGALLVIERVFGLARQASGIVAVVRQAATMLLVAVGWVFFRAPDLPHAAGLLGRMFWWHPGAVGSALSAALTHQHVAALLAGCLVFAVPARFVMGRYIQFAAGRPAAAVRLAYVSVALSYATVLIAADTFRPFLYYQF